MAEEEMEKKTAYRARGLDMKSLLQRIAEYTVSILRRSKEEQGSRCCEG